MCCGPAIMVGLSTDFLRQFIASVAVALRRRALMLVSVGPPAILSPDDTRLQETQDVQAAGGSFYNPVLG